MLPSDPRDGDRIAQFAEIRIDRLRLLLGNLHLSHLDHADNLRRQQLDCIVARMVDAWDHDHMLLGGDFNAKAERPVFDAFANHRSIITVRTPLSDAIGPGVDHLFAIRRRIASPLLISAAAAVLDSADADGVTPSDHVGVQAWVSIEPSAAPADLLTIANVPK